MVKCPPIIDIGFKWNSKLQVEMGDELSVSVCLCVDSSSKTNRSHERIEDQLSHYGTY